MYYSFEKYLNNDIFNNDDIGIKYINIFGLFGRYDIEIPFDKKVNIFIGENGMGKTTILNCIYLILEQKFHTLINIPFSKLEVIFKNENKIYEVSIADIRDYNKKTQRRFMNNVESIIINSIIPYNDILNNQNINLNEIAFEVAKRADIPISYAKRRVIDYLNNEYNLEEESKKGDKRKVISLSEAIKKNIKQRIIYLPTYRRIENDFESLNLHNEELNKNELLIRFGMSDVQLSINNILDKIRLLAMKGFTDMTGILLKQYLDGDNIYQERTIDFNKYFETVKIVLDRVGNAIELSHKEKILRLIDTSHINEPRYSYLRDLISKLINNYELQRQYDDRIKKFADTCNKYLNDKYFSYDQSTLSLKIFIDDIYDDERRILPLTQLSSGEKQIVSLFSRLYLESDKKSFVIIDEPELSLSLPWQRMLLPDIIRTNNCDLLLTVTHSPFIFENEFDYIADEMRKYIKIRQ